MAAPRAPRRYGKISGQWLAAVCARLQICPQRDLRVHVAVEPGMQTTDRFDLCGQDLLAQKTALVRQHNPILPDVAQRLATYRINRDPYRPLAVRPLLPWVALRHGNLLPAKNQV